jgi:hypothetical protein
VTLSPSSDRITVKADDGDVWCARPSGHEAKSTSSYGDPTSNAEAMAFRRAWAKHGGRAPACTVADSVTTGSTGGGSASCGSRQRHLERNAVVRLGQGQA